MASTSISGWTNAGNRKFTLTCTMSNKNDTQCTCSMHVDITGESYWFDSHLKIDEYDADQDKWWGIYDQYSTAQPEAYAAWFCKPGTSNDWTDTWGRTKATRNVRVYITGYARQYSDKSSYVSLTIPPMSNYAVTYYPNGGSGAPASQTKWYNESLTLQPASANPTRTGYTFQGWATSSTGAVVYQPGDSYTTNAALDLYAVWQINTWAVTYNANGGSGAPATQYKEYGKTLTLDTKVPTQTGYTFLGWATSSSGAVAYQPGASYTTNATLNLYAKWQLITYAITYNKNTTDNVSNMPSNGTKNYGQAYTILPQSGGTLPARTGYSFQGWATTQGGSATYQPGASYTTNAALTLYAVWQANTYTVSYDKGNTTDTVTGLPSNQTKTHGITLTLSTAKPARTGYNFTEWNTVKAGTGTVYASGASYTNNAAVTLYAQWSLITYTVSYNANGGSNAPASQTKNYGQALTLRPASANPTRTGYTFQGWNTKADGTGTNYSAGGSYTANEAVTLYAKWQLITYQVTYNANGGSGAPSAQTKSYDITLYLSSTVPTRTGYAFLGWARSASGAVEYQPGAAYTGNAALNLFAVWQPQVSTISSAGNVTLGNSCNVKWSPKVSTNKYRLKFTISNFDSGYLPSSSTFVAGSSSDITYTSYTVPIDGVAQKITTATTGTMTVTLYTYDSSGNSLGSDSRTFTVTVPSSCKPTITASITRTNTTSVINNWGVYLAGYSKATCAASASGQYGASVTSLTLTGAHTASGTNSINSTSGVLSKGAKTFKFTAKDSRGMTSEYEETINVRDYTPINITSFTATRKNNSPAIVDAAATWTFDDVNNKNTTTGRVYYKLTTDTDWTQSVTTSIANNIEPTTLGDVYTDSSSYNLRVSVTDSLGNVATKEIYLPTIAVWEHMPVGGNGVAFGKVHEGNGFEVGWKSNFYNDVKTTGQYLGYGSVEYIKGKQETSTNAWTGVTKDTALYDGKMIMYVLPYAGTSTGATLNLTLAGGGTTGEKPIYRYGGTTAITTHYAAGSRILLIYDADNQRWNSSAWYYTNSNTTYTLTQDATDGHKITLTPSSGSATTITIPDNDTTYSSKAAASGGTDVSLVTTGEKYAWNNKSNLAIGTTSSTAAAGNHTHATSIATSSKTNQITLAANTKYALTTGGTSYIFTTPPDTNTTYSAGTGLSLSSNSFSLATSGATAGSYGPSSNASPAHSGTFSVPYITVDAYGRVTAASTKTITLPASGNTDTKVKITAVDPASETSYYPLMYTATSGTVEVNAHANDSNKIRKGTTSQEGWAIHQLGNNKAYDTDGNSKGYIRLYGSGTGYGQITYTNSTANTTHVLPANEGMAGTILEVVEEGTWGNNGRYMKYSNGMAECYGWDYKTTAISSTYGSGGICYTSASATFPSGLFIAGPVINITIERSSGLCWASIYSSGASKVDFYIGSATAEVSAKIYFHVIAKGKWK